jgi:formylmethanofuran dehydrogenase subunit B
VAGLAATIGRGAMSNPLADMEKPDVIFAIGTNMTECHPVAATRLKKALRHGAKMIVADPRRIPLAELAEVYLPIRVGSDVALLLAMAHVIERDGLIDREFVAARTELGEQFFAHVRQFTPEWAETICAVPAADIEKAARLYGAAERGAIYYTLGITEHICGVDNVQSLCNLALMTGNLGREGTGINPMRGQNNIQGAGDCGALPNNFPGFQPVTDPENARRFSALYGREIEPVKGITKVRALEWAVEGKLHALLIAGENTLVTDPDRKHCQHALESLEHLVVIDLFLTETAQLADVVLPATSWAETDGVFTNTERRIQRVRAAVPPQGQARPEWHGRAGVRVAIAEGRVRRAVLGLADLRRRELGEDRRRQVPLASAVRRPPRHAAAARGELPEPERQGQVHRRRLPRPGRGGLRAVPGVADHRAAAPALSHAHDDRARGHALVRARGDARDAPRRRDEVRPRRRRPLPHDEPARLGGAQGRGHRRLAARQGVLQLQNR